jgi:hypothetical protein
VTRGVVCIQTAQYCGKDGTFRHPCCYCSWRRKFVFYRYFNLLVARKAVSLMRLVENYISDSFYSRTECHFVSKDFWISKNIAAVDILFLKLTFSGRSAPFGTVMNMVVVAKYTKLCSRAFKRRYWKSAHMPLVEAHAQS